MKYLSIVFLSFFALSAFAQQQGLQMSFEEYNPTSTLVVPGEEIRSAKFPFVDVHSHLWRMATMGRETPIVLIPRNIIGDGAPGAPLGVIFAPAIFPANDELIVYAGAF